MLLEFRIKNFKSIKEETILTTTMLKDKSNDQNTIDTNHKKIPRLLKSIMITGPNASGKSNILEGIYFMCYFLNKNLFLKPGEKIALITPFLLDDITKKNPSEFEISLLIEDVVYTYGFSLDSTKIYEEYLYYYKTNRKIDVFKRNQEKYIFPNNKDKKEQEQLSKRTDVNKLYLSVSANWKFEITAKIIKYIREKLNFINKYNNKNINVLKKIKQSETYKQKLLEAIKDVDIGIEDLKVTEEEITKEKLDRTIRLMEIIDGNKKEELMTKDNRPKIYKLETLHKYLKNNKETNIYFNMFQESSGTNEFILRMGEIISTIENEGILIIDELEINLHPELTKYINLYINSTKNKKAQIIYTTHCYDLLNIQESKLRHEQIWFTEKKKDQSTDLFSLSDFSERKDISLKINKRYFEGRYGAKPFVNYGDF